MTSIAPCTPAAALRGAALAVSPRACRRRVPAACAVLACALLAACQSTPRPDPPAAAAPAAAASAAGPAPEPSCRPLPATAAGTRHSPLYAGLAGALAGSGVDGRPVELFELSDAAALLSIPAALLFRGATADVLPGFERTLKPLASAIAGYCGLAVRVVAHTDGAGPAAAGKLLTQRRAEAVAARLQALGVDQARLSSVGMGATMPLAGNRDAAWRARNRRVENLRAAIRRLMPQRNAAARHGDDVRHAARGGSEAAAHDAAPAATPRFEALAGVDFTSRPRAAKPITVALGRLDFGPPRVVALDRIECHAGFDGFAAWLAEPGPRLAVFDLPFGLPRELVDTLARERGWPSRWRELIAHYAALPRAEVRAVFAAFCDARPAGASSRTAPATRRPARRRR